jgi:hypothetical protein
MNFPGAVQYGGLNPTGNGRFVSNAHLFFNNPQPGDKILAAYVADNDGIMPAGDQSLFTGYPVLASLIDPCLPSGNQSILIDAKKGSADLESNGQVFLPSGLYLVVKALAVSARADTFNGTVEWLCQVPQS